MKKLIALCITFLITILILIPMYRYYNGTTVKVIATNGINLDTMQFHLTVQDADGNITETMTPSIFYWDTKPNAYIPTKILERGN